LCWKLYGAPISIGAAGSSSGETRSVMNRESLLPIFFTKLGFSSSTTGGISATVEKFNYIFRNQSKERTYRVLIHLLGILERVGEEVSHLEGDYLTSIPSKIYPKFFLIFHEPKCFGSGCDSKKFHEKLKMGMPFQDPLFVHV
jgi:hypothetical protein